MKKIILSLAVVISAISIANSEYIVKNNVENNNYNIKQVKKCKMIDVKAQNRNIDGTRAICEADGVVYKFRESMINFKNIEEGKEYDVEFTGREVKIGEVTELSNLYLIDLATPGTIKDNKIKIPAKVAEEPAKSVVKVEKTAVLPFSCSITERKCVIRGFKVDGREPNSAEIADLRTIANVVNQFAQGGTIDFVGHTDSTASDAYNQKLSEDRANSIAKLLKQYGLKDTVGYGTIGGKGESEPSDTNDTVEGRYNNRRVELFFYNVDFSNVQLTN